MPGRHLTFVKGESEKLEDAASKIATQYSITSTQLGYWATELLKTEDENERGCRLSAENPRSASRAARVLRILYQVLSNCYRLPMLV